MTDEAVHQVESDLGVRLPEDFRAIVVDNDGGRPRPQALLLPNRREVILERLLTTVPEHGDTISVAAQALKAQGHDGLIPFAMDPFGNVFCFQKEGATLGTIVLWNHETDGIQAVCESFTELLSMLREPA